MKQDALRPAIAMIELIFAIVIIGFALLSAPLLIHTSVKSGYVAIQQEAINEAASRINMILSYPWDENDSNPIYSAPILHVTNGASELDEVVFTDPVTGNDYNTSRRQGMPSFSSRSFTRSDGTVGLFASSVLGAEGGDSDDMDDFIGDTNLTLAGVGTGPDYIERTNINIKTSIVYGDDTVTGGYNQNSIVFNPFSSKAASTNIKSITVKLTSDTTLSSEELNKSVVLRAFSCNVGSYELVKRDF